MRAYTYRGWGPWGPAGALAALLAVAGGLSSCGMLGAQTGSASAPATPTRTASTQPRLGVTGAGVTGTWVYTDPKTVETIHLRQARNGVVTGNGAATDRGNAGKIGHSGIAVHGGKARNGTVSLELYVSQLDWGTGLTIVENLQCATTARALRCRMSAPLYPTVRNIPQTFARR